MSTSRRNADRFAIQVMLGLCLIWGIQQVVIKWAAADIAPVMQAAGRSGISALLVGLLMCWKGGWSHIGATWRGGLLAGALFGLEFLFISEGLQRTSAAHMSVFLYTAPIFTALGVNWLLPSERLKPLQWLGIGLAFVGIVFAFAGGVSFSDMDSNMLLGDALGVLAGAAWGATTVVVRASRLSEAPVTLTLFYQLIVGFVGLLAIAAVSGQIGHVSLTAVAVGSVLFQGLVVSFFSYLVWFWLLQRYLASNLAVFSFMTPMFGVTFGVVLLGDPLSFNFVIGAVLVLLGITLVSAEQWIRRRLRKALGQ
ncbi:EamA/RhaT family transporter [Pseudomonas gingeri NCPPB 3146 = LMG 5327]|uniref:DMT family transporter n=2 Tax=Pseudomonas gingeri TaxID=117681 RepID=A0A7Y8CH32_9PSED|nr:MULTISPECIES: DMT family transporter [Pseudomonas]NVZ30214.1 DMT family transporter [Pseudomonas gingeri]NVZ63761.1 DMT family transporter [Pseudomonas gingeri]NVZ74488.1 DMT family transporter [Pseudomonas gingeri]NWA00841.1 DMT family transporter [Pseudomonas gingeri]NWA10417.1 DMT family transporter [Pseudomonas gingeri]